MKNLFVFIIKLKFNYKMVISNTIQKVYDEPSLSFKNLKSL